MNKINDPDRLKAVYSYNIMDTPPEKDIDDLNELASIIANTNISLISIIDNHRQWYKSHKGIEASQVLVEDSFCQYTLDQPDKILEIPDARKDDRFRMSPFVTEDPNIRFYASVPLVSKDRQVIGTLCVADNNAKVLNESQKKALSLLAKMAMEKLELRKEIRRQTSEINFGAQRLIKITENAPSAIFELSLEELEPTYFTFMSRGIKNLFPEPALNDWLRNSQATLQLVMGDTYPAFIEEIKQLVAKDSSDVQRIDFPHQTESKLVWFSLQFKVEDFGNEKVVYGSIHDVSKHYEFKDTMDQVLFDISHVVRRPVTTVLGLLEYIEEEEVDYSPEAIKEYLEEIKAVNVDLDNFTKDLNEQYQKRKEEIFNADASENKNSAE